MSKRITILQEGYPDPAGGHFIHALDQAYERAAREAARTTVIGMVEGSKDAREGWLTRLAVLGNEAS